MEAYGIYTLPVRLLNLKLYKRLAKERVPKNGQQW